MSRTLNNICDELAYIRNKLELGEPIDTEYLDTLKVDRDKKFEGIGYALLGIKYLIQEAKEEIARIQQYKKYLENEEKRLKNYAIFCMNREDMKVFKGKNIRLMKRKSPMSAEYVTNSVSKDPLWQFIDERFIKEEVVKKVDKIAAIRHHKETGEEIDGINFIDDKESIVVS